MSDAAQHRSEDKKSNETGASTESEEQPSVGVHAIEALVGSVDPVYAAKAQALNDAIQSIGMGRYQVSLSFFLLVQSSFAWLLRHRVRPPFYTLSSYFLLG
jgi:hypothetical protein